MASQPRKSVFLPFEVKEMQEEYDKLVSPRDTQAERELKAQNVVWNHLSRQASVEGAGGNEATEPQSRSRGSEDDDRE